MSWKDIKIGTKIVASFMVVLVLMLGIGIWTFQVSTSVANNAEKVKDESLVFAGTVQQMRVDVIQVQQWLTDISATRAQDGLNDGFDEAEKSYQSFLTGLASFGKKYKAENNREKLQEIKDLRTQADVYYEAGKKMASAYIDGGPGAGNQLMDSFDTAAANLYDTLDPFISEQVAGTENAMGEIALSVNNLKMGMMVAFLVAFLITMVAGFLLRRSISQPLLAILAVTKDIAEGDLTTKVEVTSNDEIGQLQSAMKKMTDKLFAIVSEVKNGTEAISCGSDEVSRGNADLSQRTEEQASSLEETASSMEEMTSTVKQNADNASQANQLAAGARTQAEKGGEVVGNAITAMAEINSSSKKIADIISVIDEIAFQTNLLALNAAVEAARAGEQGRGFAVVAGEVRSLAGRSAEAAKEIKDLIQDSVEKVQQGTDLVDESGKTLEEIVNSVKKVTDIVSEIASSSQEQATGIEEVNKAIMQMDGMTQQNAALVEEAAAASESMSEQSRNLQQQISFFNVGREGSMTSSHTATSSAQRTATDDCRRGSGRPFVPEPQAAPKSSAPAAPLAKTGTDDEWSEF